MIKRIAALGFIFICTSVAWMILGATVSVRTSSPESDDLRSRVASNWGTPQVQNPPTATFQRQSLTSDVTDKGEKQIPKIETIALPLSASNVKVAFDLAHRRKGLLWYSTYTVDFAGAYTFTNTSSEDQEVTFRLAFPSQQAMYDNLSLTVDGQPPAGCTSSGYACGTTRVPAGKQVALAVGYRSQGLDSWRYHFSDGISETRNLALQMHTNFREIDFPENTISPTEERPTADGWNLGWNYNDLVSGYEIGMTMPQKLQPGPLAGEISYFAPVSLFFFFFVIFMITTIRGINLHPMNYFFLAAAFFAFHLLLAYLVDHVSIHIAFIVCSLVSVSLVVSYLRLVVGIRFAALEAGLAQFIYLVLFSYAFFFKGFTGLAITIGSILTLFVAMQATGRIRWDEQLAAPKSGVATRLGAV